MHISAALLALGLAPPLTGMDDSAAIFKTVPPVLSQGEETNNLFVAPPVPDDLGQPSRRSDAGSRDCVSGATDTVTELTALVPLYQTPTSAMVYSLTTAERPTLWLYVPFAVPLAGRLALQDAADNLLYEGHFTTLDEPGIVGLSLPALAAPWAVGDRYQWFVVLGCTADSISYGVNGWVERTAIAPADQAAIAALPPAAQVDAYGAQGLWHEALTTAATLPSNTQWTALLQGIGLAVIAPTPRLDCCALQPVPSEPAP